MFLYKNESEIFFAICFQSLRMRKGLNTIGTGNRHRQQGITSRPIRVLVCKFDIIS